MYWQANLSERSVYQLLINDTRLAYIAFINRENGIGKITDAAVKKEHIWVFKTEKLNNSEVFKIYDAQTKAQFANIKLDASSNGEIALPNDKKMGWAQTSWTSFDRAWTDSGGEPLVVYELNNPRIAENFVGLKLAQNAKDETQIFLLILLGWALILKEKCKMGVKILAEGNPQEFLAESKIKEIFGIDLKVADFNTKFVAPVAATAASENTGSSESLIDAEDVVDVGIDAVFSLLDW